MILDYMKPRRVLCDLLSHSCVRAMAASSARLGSRPPSRACFVARHELADRWHIRERLKAGSLEIPRARSRPFRTYSIPAGAGMNTTCTCQSVVSDVLLPHEPQLVRRGHRQRGRRQVRLLRR